MFTFKEPLSYFPTFPLMFYIPNSHESFLYDHLQTSLYALDCKPVTVHLKWICKRPLFQRTELSPSLLLSLKNSRYWRSGEPNEYRSGEDCVESKPDYESLNTWNDERCTTQRNWVCERVAC